MTHECSKEEELKTMKSSINKRVTWIIFTWSIGILAIAFGWSLTVNASISKKVEENNNQFSEIKSQLSGIQADLVWLKQSSSKNSDFKATIYKE